MFSGESELSSKSSNETNISDMENMRRIAATVEYFTIQRTMSESRIAYDRYSATRHQSEQNRYSEARAVTKDSMIRPPELSWGALPVVATAATFSIVAVTAAWPCAMPAVRLLFSMYVCQKRVRTSLNDCGS